MKVGADEASLYAGAIPVAGNAPSIHAPMAPAGWTGIGSKWPAPAGAAGASISTGVKADGGEAMGSGSATGSGRGAKAVSALSAGKPGASACGASWAGSWISCHESTVSTPFSSTLQPSA